MTLSPRLLNVANRAPGADLVTLCARPQIPSYPVPGREYAAERGKAQSARAEPEIQAIVTELSR